MEHYKSYPVTRFRRPTRRGPSRHPASFGQPLMLLDDNAPVVGRRPVVSPRGQIELSSVVSAYQPPSITGQQQSQLPQEAEQQQNDPFFYPSPQHSTTVNQNPAPDLAFSLFSHGCCCMQCVRTQEIGITEECGRFDRIVGPGLYCLMWPISSIAGRIPLRIQQLEVTLETKTSDHVFCQITLALLYRIVKPYEAFYRLADPMQLIQTCVLNAVRSTVPTMTMDTIFMDKQQILISAVFASLQPVLRDYGYDAVTCLVTQIQPNELVKASMNEIMASRRLKQAAAHKAEANKVQVVRHAEATAEQDASRGVGTARERQAVAEGMRESIQVWREMDVRVVAPPDVSEVMELLLVTQYLDVLTQVGADHMQVQHGVSADTLRSIVG
jgi:regulator of protease activity HflC (stomatin/prohibitin superfamily)